MNENNGTPDHILRIYKCGRCENTFEAERQVASTCPICGYSCSENLSSETDISNQEPNFSSK